MTNSQIVIVTQKADMHTDDMIRKLYELRHDPVRLNTDDIPLNTILNFRLDGTDRRGGIKILNSRREINIRDIRSIWWRRPGAYGLPPELSEREREFAQEEINQVLRGLLPTDCYWVSYPEHIRQARWKIGQLERAVQHGFEAPRTLITTDPDEARAFYDTCRGKMIFKVLSDSCLGGQQVAETHSDQVAPEPRETLTTMITEAELEQLDCVRLVPCLFQEYIPKRVELRVTIIGDEIFAAEIDSQSDINTTVDFRNDALGIPYRKATLPVEVAERCMALARSYHLNFSAMDLILTPDGRYVFLESNPNGQFMWVEKLVPELEMTAALAACLIRGANS
jgi:glutathione synthase/RimK-type ligase-like ATP-grasp enzyme